MNKNIKLAVAGAVLSLSAVSANAGIIIPAGEWTLDIGGNVNTFATMTRYSGDWVTPAKLNLANGDHQRTVSNMTTGLLPNYLSVSGTTRQNDLDVAFTISINPGSSTGASGIQNAQQENRQAFLTFGDKSWGSVKIGKDLGIFASDAILNDMTLLGVGNGAGGLVGNTTTLGRIGAGYTYADWKAQIAYTTPNFSGLQATVGLTQAWDATGGAALTSTRGRAGAGTGYEAKASYSFASGDATGKVWVSALAQSLKEIPVAGVFTNGRSDTAHIADIGANVAFAGFNVTGYYFNGEGLGIGTQFSGAFDNAGQLKDSDGGYIQATYVLPTKTKLGVSWGESNLDTNGTAADIGNTTSEMWTVGLYHPLTKHLNLVAEYSDHNTKIDANALAGTGRFDGTARTGSIGAILFF